MEQLFARPQIGALCLAMSQVTAYLTSFLARETYHLPLSIVLRYFVFKNSSVVCLNVILTYTLLVVA